MNHSFTLNIIKIHTTRWQYNTITRGPLIMSTAIIPDIVLLFHFNSECVQYIFIRYNAQSEIKNYNTHYIEYMLLLLCV